MRKRSSVALFACVLALCASSAAYAADGETVALTGGLVSFYLGERGGGQLLRDRDGVRTVSGYYNADGNQAPLFTVNVVGYGLVGGGYRFIDDGSSDPFYFDNCCASLTISTLPPPLRYVDVGAAGQTGSAA